MERNLYGQFSEFKLFDGQLHRNHLMNFLVLVLAVLSALFSRIALCFTIFLDLTTRIDSLYELCPSKYFVLVIKFS